MNLTTISELEILKRAWSSIQSDIRSLEQKVRTTNVNQAERLELLFKAIEKREVQANEINEVVEKYEG